MNNTISDFSKSLSHPDDSAGALLIELLEGNPGRNFDIESVFLERLETGEWRWVVYEFLKAEPTAPPPHKSHPNYYWHMNKRKFLSLWALVCTLRKAGCLADLILINYANDRTLGVKEMLVETIDEYPSDVFREESSSEGETKPPLMNHVVTKNQCMTFNEFKTKFQNFNHDKKGNTWEILSDLSVAPKYEHLAKKVLAAVAESGLEFHTDNRPSPSASPASKNENLPKTVSTVTVQAICEDASCGANVNENVASFSMRKFSGKVYCYNCQKKYK